MGALSGLSCTIIVPNEVVNLTLDEVEVIFLSVADDEVAQMHNKIESIKVRIANLA